MSEDSTHLSTLLMCPQTLSGVSWFTSDNIGQQNKIFVSFWGNYYVFLSNFCMLSPKMILVSAHVLTFLRYQYPHFWNSIERSKKWSIRIWKTIHFGIE